MLNIMYSWDNKKVVFNNVQNNILMDFKKLYHILTKKSWILNEKIINH